MGIIEVHNLNYKTMNKDLFKNIDLIVEEGSFTSIIGENKVGKSTLIKLLSGSIITDNNIKIDNIQVNKFSVEDIMKKRSFIFSYNEFFSKTVTSEILQDKKAISVYDVNKVKKILDDFNLLYLQNASPQKLSYAENQIVALIKAIVSNSKIIFLDNAFSLLDEDKRNELLFYLKNYSKKNNITVVMATNNIQDLKYSDRILLLKNKEISFDGTYDELIEKDLTKEGLKIPFEIEVSSKLIMYDLIDKVSDNIDDLVVDLCK